MLVLVIVKKAAMFVVAVVQQALVAEREAENDHCTPATSSGPIGRHTDLMMVRC